MTPSTPSYLRHRIFVMNGCLVVQIEGQSAASPEWATVHVQRTPDVKPGLYSFESIAPLVRDEDRSTIEQRIMTGKRARSRRAAA
ncbi:hypothetical protein [Burkholderia sp. BCC1993]|uniref:hypothetical protein n=1 Tax=Burkholderia sp. BCC1993 TaxID=2817444 RepID=UPI002AB0E65D|nr:hypothetical protein [Burkholderia sp. BCC1993]